MRLGFASVGIILAIAQSAYAGCQPGNYIDNCGFPSNILGWTTTSGTASYDSTGGNSTPGSIEVVATGTNITFQQCVDVSALTLPLAANFGIDHRDSSSNNIETVTVSVTDYTDAACTSGNETGNSSNASDGLTSTSYRQVSGSYTIGASAQGVLFRVDALPFASTITGDFDDAFLGTNVVPVTLQSFAID
jgi:hypothetical protein